MLNKYYCIMANYFKNNKQSIKIWNVKDDNNDEDNIDRLKSSHQPAVHMSET